jgi:hypothetical protein
MKPQQLFFLFLAAIVLLLDHSPVCHALSSTPRNIGNSSGSSTNHPTGTILAGAPRYSGSAAHPAHKKKLVVLGGAGYMGAITFGFLQRAGNLFGTGVGREVRCLGACSETAVRLNRVLSKHYCLAVADESFIKLTNLASVDAIVQRLEGYDALILGTNLGVSKKPVTGNTFEQSPNDKTWEIYWDPPSTLVTGNVEEEQQIKQDMLSNVLLAANQAGIRHIVVVDDDDGENSRDSKLFMSQLQQSNVPYTYIRPAGKLVAVSDYTYRKGVQGALSVTLADDDHVVVSAGGRVNKEDLAALAVQTLLSLDWAKSRCLQVVGHGPWLDDGLVNPKRPDQEWCVNSYRLHATLAGVL